MSDDQAEHPESDKEQVKMLVEKWVNDGGTLAKSALQLVQSCREARSQLGVIQPSVLYYRHRMQMWRAKAAVVDELENEVSRISDLLFQLQVEWGTFPHSIGSTLVMQNDLALLRESRSQMMTELASLKSDLTNIHQTLIGHLANFLAWLSISLGVLSVSLAVLSVVITLVP